MNSLARLYEKQGEFTKAEQLFVQALEGRRRVRGEEHPDTLVSMDSLAGLYEKQGEFTKAEQLFVRALEGRRRVLGENDPRTLSSMVNMAAFYWNTMKLDLSVPLYEEVLKRRQASLGSDHPRTLLTMADPGVNYRDAGRLPEATKLLEQAWAKAREQNDAQVDKLFIRSSLAEAYDRAGQLAKAESLYRESLQEASKRHGKESRRVARVMEFLARNLVKQRRFAEAEQILRDCLKLRERHEPNDWETFNTKSLYGASLLGQKKLAEAEPPLLAGYEGMKRREPTMPPDRKITLGEAIERLVQLYEAWGQPEKAAAWRARLGPTDLPADVFARP
jgi:tetratricopeptide (TPR) repeat protein